LGKDHRQAEAADGRNSLCDGAGIIRRAWKDINLQRRYYPWSEFLREQFGSRVTKIPVHAGFDCPNRDGRVGQSGCIFCWNPSFSPAIKESSPSLTAQIRTGKEAASGHDQRKFLVYFQSYTNTYAPVDKLRLLYDAALADPDVVGLCIATRPDCVPGPVLDMLEEYARRCHLWLELGLQSANDRTLAIIKRGHTRADFEDAVIRSSGRGFYVCAHVILGLPGEGRREMLETGDFLSSLPVQGVKIHHLQVIAGTPLEAMYQCGQVAPLNFSEYLQLVCDFLERLRPDITIHRLMGEVLDGSLLVAPRWQQGKAAVINAVENELALRGSRQGSCCQRPEAGSQIQGKDSTGSWLGVPTGGGPGDLFPH
jgi:radical SAM protein (TIGR01212 family)